MVVNVSYIIGDKPLKDNMWITAEDRYQNTDIDFFEIAYKICSDMVQYSPYRFNNNKKIKENWDNSKQNMLVFDFDDGLTLLEAMDIFDEYTYLMVTTKKHQVGEYGDRFRVLLPAENIPRDKQMYFRMLELMSEQLPMDTQVNNETGAFLGCSTASSFYNDGKIYDCSDAIEGVKQRRRQEDKSYRAKCHIENTEANNTSIREVREHIDGSLSKTMLEDLGYEFRGMKFRLREDDRSPSVMVYPSGYIIDYGGDFQGDILDVLHKYHGMDFSKSLDYVGTYIRSIA